jgi:anaerobic magnesium-protoporphyrin IX monomethyl ester cyclase
MKVVVANPPWPGEGFGARSNTRWPHRRGDKRLVFPIYLSYTVSVLKKAGYDVKGMDAVWEEWGIRRFSEEVKKINPKVVVLEVSTPSIMYDLETAEAIKEKLPSCTIILCGPHATYFHKKIIENYMFVDVCIRGEFETAVKDVCEAIKKDKSLSTVKGITYRDGSKKIVSTPERELLRNLDELPYPDRTDFPIERYQQAFYCGKKTALLLSSRGCPFQCTYCLWPSTLTRRRYRSRDPGKVADEIEYLMKHEGIDEVFFDDDEFTVDRQKVMGFCKEILSRGIRIKWHCMGRVDIVEEELLSQMRKAGCYQIFYGFESGSERVLKGVKKGITKDQIRKAVRMTRKAGIVCGGSFILGTPEESWETYNETMGFAKSLGADWVQFALCAPFPGTPMHEEATRLGLIDVASWADFDGTMGAVIRTKHLSKEELSGIIRKAYISYYTSPRVILTNLSRVRSGAQARRIARGAKSVLSRLFYYDK